MELQLESILLFFSFVAPGFLFTRTYLAYRPRYYRAPNAFEQIALFLIGSAFIHTTLLGAAAAGLLLHWLFTGQTWTATQLVGWGMPISQYPLHILAFYLFITAAYVILSLIVSRRTAIFLGKRTSRTVPRWWIQIMGEDPPENFLLWYIILQEEAMEKGLLPTKIAIRLNNGDHFEGHLNRLKLVGDEENTIELAINHVSYRSGDDPDTAPLTPLPHRTILLKSNDILWLGRSDIS